MQQTEKFFFILILPAKLIAVIGCHERLFSNDCLFTVTPGRCPNALKRNSQRHDMPDVAQLSVIPAGKKDR